MLWANGFAYRFCGGVKFRLLIIYYKTEFVFIVSHNAEKIRQTIVYISIVLKKQILRPKISAYFQCLRNRLFVSLICRFGRKMFSNRSDPHCCFFITSVLLVCI